MDLEGGSIESPRVRVGWLNRVAGVMAVVLMVAHSAPSFAAGDAAHGATVYRQCMICHSLDKNGIGPSHHNVFGRAAGSVANYTCSAALKTSNIVWNETTLDQWLANPQALVPGTKMMFSVDNAQDRADVIAFSRKRREPICRALRPAKNDTIVGLFPDSNSSAQTPITILAKRVTHP
jgi:cytochrome c